MEYTRNAKIWQIEHTQEFEQVLSIYRRLLNDISQLDKYIAKLKERGDLSRVTKFIKKKSFMQERLALN